MIVAGEIPTVINCAPASRRSRTNWPAPPDSSVANSTGRRLASYAVSITTQGRGASATCCDAHPPTYSGRLPLHCRDVLATLLPTERETEQATSLRRRTCPANSPPQNWQLSRHSY